MPLAAASRTVGWISRSQLRSGRTATVMGRVMEERAKVRKRGSAFALLARQIVEDRAVGPIVAATGVNERAERLRHRLHFGDARLELRHVAFGDAPDLAAR